MAVRATARFRVTAAAAQRSVVLRPVAVPDFGDGPPPTVPPIANAQLAILILIVFETMAFVGLVTAYWVLRTNSFAWPPPNLPRLPLSVTWVNTAMLLFSALTMSRATAAVREPHVDGTAGRLRSALLATAVLGAGFLAVQGTEWARLIKQGLTLSSGTYGATFYALIGLHAVHVLAAVMWLLAVLAIAQWNGYAVSNALRVKLCATYWYFVCILWVVLFGAVYLY